MMEAEDIIKHHELLFWTYDEDERHWKLIKKVGESYWEIHPDMSQNLTLQGEFFDTWGVFIRCIEPTK